MHPVHVVLEIGILQAVFLDSTDLTGITDKVVDMHSIRLVGLEYGLQAIGLVPLRSVLLLDNAPTVLLYSAVHSARLYLQI